ncbi:SsgA family sporulation/cell division regulator [Pseudonocardia parietis]|uniref:Sporulation and cell division protein SsgA n=1 Tax=Pseudonocardia parietis TaxID=570936 RepID=A0ABS4W3K6_9PSEU|nr:SsgA family sporulation/cell division regulator [Pseudonocardia parietis]MBP2370269.1 hypothetical protein [Pseudonocardia parietis]
MSNLGMEFEATITGQDGIVNTVVELVWDPVRPLYFEMGIAGYPDLDWIIGRDLLAAGIAVCAGTDDVRVYPDGDPASAADLVIVLASPTGRCEIRIDRFDVDILVSRTVRDVPLGAEVAVPDRVPAEWLGMADDGSTS